MGQSSVTTIGFAKTTAERFLERLRGADARTLIDVRLNNKSQLAGFAKATDQAYFLKVIAGMRYVHQPLLAPTEAMLTAYKKEKGDWGLFQNRFMALMAERRIESKSKAEVLNDACLFCSDDTLHHCHRRVVCDYLNHRWGGVLRVRHLLGRPRSPRGRLRARAKAARPALTRRRTPMGRWVALSSSCLRK